MNWQLMFEMPEWASNLDKLLLVLPIIGTVFKLTQYDQQLGRPTDTILMPEMVTVITHQTTAIGLDVSVLTW